MTARKCGPHHHAVYVSPDSRVIDPIEGHLAPAMHEHRWRESSIEPQPAVDDETFMHNVREALSNGYDRLCANCGIGTAGDDMDIRERACPEYRA